MLQLKKKLCLSKFNRYLFVNGTEIIKFKGKDSETVANPLCLGNISEDIPADGMKKKNWTVWFFFGF